MIRDRCRGEGLGIIFWRSQITRGRSRGDFAPVRVGLARSGNDLGTFKAGGVSATFRRRDRSALLCFDEVSPRSPGGLP
jgi:hypothetical protein